MAWWVLEPEAITIILGPIDLPVPHSGDLAASMPKHVFTFPEDRPMTGYNTEIFTMDGKTLPADGILLGFPDRQIYSDPVGFPVSTKEVYQMVLVHHRPLHFFDGDIRGMVNYLLSMTREPSPRVSDYTMVSSLQH